MSHVQILNHQDHFQSAVHAHMAAAAPKPLPIELTVCVFSWFHTCLSDQHDISTDMYKEKTISLFIMCLSAPNSLEDVANLTFICERYAVFYVCLILALTMKS